MKNRYCPEYYEATGIKRYDFEEVVVAENGKVQYRCEDCNVTWTVNGTAEEAG